MFNSVRQNESEGLKLGCILKVLMISNIKIFTNTSSFIYVVWQLDVDVEFRINDVYWKYRMTWLELDRVQLKNYTKYIGSLKLTLPKFEEKIHWINNTYLLWYRVTCTHLSWTEGVSTFCCFFLLHVWLIL